MTPLSDKREVFSRSLTRRPSFPGYTIPKSHVPVFCGPFSVVPGFPPTPLLRQYGLEWSVKTDVGQARRLL